jgi:hypothetical protein
MKIKYYNVIAKCKVCRTALAMRQTDDINEIRCIEYLFNDTAYNYHYYCPICNIHKDEQEISICSVELVEMIIKETEDE